VLTGACPLLGKFGGDWSLGVNSCTGLRAAGLRVLIVARLMFASLRRSGVEGSLIRLIALHIPMSVKIIAKAPNVQATIRLGILYQLSDNTDMFSSSPAYHFVDVAGQNPIYVSFCRSRQIWVLSDQKFKLNCLKALNLKLSFDQMANVVKERNTFKIHLFILRDLSFLDIDQNIHI
jgi:hypothetical protein